MHRLHRTQWVPGGLATVFDFFRRPENLKRITPPWLDLGVESATDPVIRVGTRIHYRFRWLALPLRWETEITAYDENRMFVDEMVRGPYRHWRHRHVFREENDGVTLEDRVEYALPFGPVGRFAHRLAVRDQLQQIFDHRAEVVAKNAVAWFGRPGRDQRATG